jgi:hypothetical protein
MFILVLHPEDLDITRDNLKQIIEIMGKVACKDQKGFHAPGMVPLLLETTPGLLGLNLDGNIPDYHGQIQDTILFNPLQNHLPEQGLSRGSSQFPVYLGMVMALGPEHFLHHLHDRGRKNGIRTQPQNPVRGIPQAFARGLVGIPDTPVPAIHQDDKVMAEIKDPGTLVKIPEWSMQLTCTGR